MRLVALAAAALAPGVSQAAHPLITEDTGTQGSGRWQLEVNAESSRDRREGVTTRGLQPAATLSYGAADNIDLQLTVPYLRQKTEGVVAGGRLDTALDAKWRFYEDGPLSLGLKPGLVLPTGREDDGLGAGRTTWGSLLIFSYDREGWALHSHAGYRRNRNTLGERESLTRISAAFWLKATEQLKVVMDRTFDTNPDRSSGTTIRHTVVGFIHSVTPAFDFDAGIRRGNDPAIDRALLFGATLRW